MNARAVAINEIERTADEVTAFVLLAKIAGMTPVFYFRLLRVSVALNRLFKIMSPERLGELPQDAAVELRKQLEETHREMAAIARSEETSFLSQYLLFSYPLNRMRTDTETLGDIIEDLILAGSQDFRALVADCASSLNLPRAKGVSAQVRD